MTPTTTRQDEIVDEMLKEFKIQKIEDTPLHRLWFLQGLYDGWKEDDSDNCLEKTLWMLTLIGMISNLKMQLRFSGIAYE